MASPITLPAPEQSSFLTRSTIVERVDCRNMEALLASDHLLLEWSSKDCWFVDTLKKHYQNEKKQISLYAAAYNTQCDGVVVKYCPSAKHKYGRLFVYRSQGFTNMRRPVRHTVANYYYDFDIVNCQPELLVRLLDLNSVRCPGPLRSYVSNRNDIIQMHMDAWNIKKEDKWLVKQLFIRLFFMGGYEQYKEDMKGYGYRLPLYATGFISALQSSLLEVARELKKHNPVLYKVAANKRKENNDNSADAALKTFMALYLQTYERRIVESVMESVDSATSLMKRSAYPGYLYTSYEYDGFKLLKENVDNYQGGKEAVCQLIEMVTLEVTKLPLKWAVKEMDEAYDLSYVELPEVSMKELKTDMETCMVSHRRMADIIKARYSDTKYIFELYDKQWYTYDSNCDNWEKSEFFLLRDMSKILDSLFNYPAYMKDDKYKAAFDKFMAKSGSSSWMAGVEKMARAVMYKDKVEFDMNTDVINFTNGIYEIDTGRFRRRTMEDFVTLSTGYDYSELLPEDEKCKEEVMAVLKQIHPVEEDLRLNLVIMASGLSGRAIEKFFVFNGCGRNGKSLLNSAMKIILGNYYLTANVAILTEDMRRKSSGEANSALAAIDKIRYCVFREPPKNVPIQNANMKDLTGGGEIVARELFKKQKAARLDLTAILETNSKPPFCETTTEAEAERVIDYHFQSHFTSDESKLAKAKEKGTHVYPLRTELKEKDWWVKRRNAFLHILLENLNLLRDSNYDIMKFVPEHVKVRSKEYCQTSILVVKLFHELFYIPPENEVAPYEGWDRDISISNAVSYIRSSENFSSQPGSVRYGRDSQPIAMRTYLEEHCEERLEVLYVYKKQKFIGKFRKRHEGPVNETDLESTSEFDLVSEHSTDVL